MSASANITILVSMLGIDVYNENVINMHNDRMKSLIKSSLIGYKQPIHLHYLKNEHTYEDKY